MPQNLSLYCFSDSISHLIRMLKEKGLDAEVLKVIIYVLLPEAFYSSSPLLQLAHHSLLSSLCNFSDCRSSPSVLFGKEIASISPHVLENFKDKTVFRVRS